MAVIRYAPVCKDCGKRGTIIQRGTGTRPTGVPQIFGTCPNNPSGKHNPRWEEV